MKNKTFVLAITLLSFIVALAVAPATSWAVDVTVDGVNTGGTEWNEVAPVATDYNEDGIGEDDDIEDKYDVWRVYITTWDDNLFLRIDTYDPTSWVSDEEVFLFLDIDNDSGTGCVDGKGHIGGEGFETRIRASREEVRIYTCGAGNSWNSVNSDAGTSAAQDFLEISAGPLSNLGLDYADVYRPVNGYVFFDNGVQDPEDETPNTNTFNPNPLLIELKSFVAHLGDESATLQWETASEIDNAGFHIWRSDSEDGEYVRITDVLISAQGDSVTGASYVYEDLDASGTGYSYQLEDIDYNGVSTFHDLTARYVALVPGWNILDGDAFAGLSVSGALSSIAGKYASVWGPTGSGWQMYNPDKPAFSYLKTFEAGNDYWLYVTDNCDLALP